VDEQVNFFELLGLEPRFGMDVGDLRRRLLRITRDIHPDFFGTAAPELRALAEQNSARVNKAFEVLADDVERADWIVTHLGGPDEQAERAMPREFLMEVLDWNEVLEEARARTDALDPRLAALAASLAERRAGSLAKITALLTPLPPRGSQDLTRARQELNAVRYVDRALREIEALRLARAATH
jgi:molecular chaperone HscB